MNRRRAIGAFSILATAILVAASIDFPDHSLTRADSEHDHSELQVLRGDWIPPFDVVTQAATELVMSGRTAALLVKSTGMSEEGVSRVREFALEELESNDLRAEHFLEDICANADFYASSAMDLAEKAVEHEIESGRLKNVRIEQLSEDLSPSDLDKFLTHSIGRAQSMIVIRTDMRVFATQGLLDARGYVKDICGSQV